jgi:hypothetical protein
VIVMRSGLIFVRPALLSLLLCPSVSAQIQIGVISGPVTDPAGARVAGAKIRLSNPITGYDETRAADARGEFAFNNVPFAVYSLRVEAAGFQPAAQTVSLRSNLPLLFDLKLNVAATGGATTVEARAALISADSASSETELTENFIRRAPAAAPGPRLQRLIATTAGWTTQNNGLTHIRGVDDGILFVVDGIPTVDRLDAVSASSFDTDMIRSLNVITGNIPAEFGGRSGAVVQIQPKSGIDSPFVGSVGVGGGSFRASDLTATIGGSFNRKFGFFVANSASRSDRFLDPVDPGNFDNRGGAVKFNARIDWHPSGRDILLFDLATNGSDFRAPNRAEQELAGQRQRQELRDNSQTISWQRVWSPSSVSNVAYFRRDYRARLFGGEHDTPIFSEQDRRHVRQGFIASLTRAHRQHTIKSGVEFSRVTPREFFTFAITDEEEAEENEISDAALKFNLDNPFVFRDRRTGANFSWYAQDVFSPVKNLTINAGLRYDRSTLPATDHQLSPRIGVVYHLPSTRTAIRASFNRLYMPPQVENLLLADSA